MNDIKIKFTAHAQMKIKQRNILKNDIEEVIKKPYIIIKDKFDKELFHFIGMVNNKYLRVIGKWITKNELLIISSFFDRRLLKKKGRLKC